MHAECCWPGGREDDDESSLDRITARFLDKQIVVGMRKNSESRAYQ